MIGGTGIFPRASFLRNTQPHRAGHKRHLVFWLCLAFHASPAPSETLRIQIDRLDYQSISIEALRGWANPEKWELTIASLAFPFPPWKIEPLSLSCLDYTDTSLTPSRCRQGRLSGNLPHLRLPLAGRYRFDFAGDGEKSLDLAPLEIGDSSWKIHYNQHGDRWRFDLASQRQTLSEKWIKPLLPRFLQWIKQISGWLALTLHARGKAHATHLNMRVDGHKISLNDENYSKVLEKLRLGLRLDATHGGQTWSGNLNVRAGEGEALFLPIYVPLTDNPVNLRSSFLWDPSIRRLELQVRVRQAGVGSVVGIGTVDNGIISRLTGGFRTNLLPFFRLYAIPFLQGGNWQTLEVNQGSANGRFLIVSGKPEKGRIILDGVTLSDTEHRIGVNGLNARLYWQKNFHNHGKLFPTSWISWHAAHLYAIPVGKTNVFLRLTGDDLRLIHTAILPVLDGRLRIQRLDFLNLTTTPQIRFAGDIETISLELLTRVLKIPPLSGTLSGNVPEVKYDHESHTLELEGKLTIEVFDGTVTVENLVVTNLFGPLPRLRADIHFKNLDLERITRHFSFGRITGKVEGYIKSLYLEDWRPVAFDAWIETPPDDTGRHRISQQAIDNLTDLGGGGATGLISRTFLRVFEDFGYDRLGLGLKLSGQVCRLRGITPAPNGYYIVTGGGLPRIDVIGYNRRIDWQTLLARLKRITQIQTPVVQ